MGHPRLAHDWVMAAKWYRNWRLSTYQPLYQPCRDPQKFNWFGDSYYRGVPKAGFQVSRVEFLKQFNQLLMSCLKSQGDQSLAFVDDQGERPFIWLGSGQWDSPARNPQNRLLGSRFRKVCFPHSFISWIVMLMLLDDLSLLSRKPLSKPWSCTN